MQKKIIFLSVWLVFTYFSSLWSQQQLYVGINNDINQVEVINIIYDAYQPHFTIGHHQPDSCLKLTTDKYRIIYQGNLGLMKREKPSGYFPAKYDGRVGVYHISSGVVPADLQDSLHLNFFIPQKSVLIKGKIFREKGTITFKDYFEAREFPFFWFDTDKYRTELTPLNHLDTIQIVYAWVDSSGFSLLDTVRNSLLQAINTIGKIAPHFWHKHIQHWGKIEKYTLMVFLGTPPLGLEHFSSPLIGINWDYLYTTTELTIHEMLHSFIGKATIPREYLVGDGKFYSTDVLGYYEGLVSYLADRMLPKEKFASILAWNVSNAKMFNENDLRAVSLTDKKYESYYFKGYLFWLVLNSKFDFIDNWIKWLFEEKLTNRSIPVPTNMDSVLTWLSEYDHRIGNYASAIISGEYMQIADSLLTANGFEPLYFKNDSSYCWAYIGPYPLYQSGMVLPVDTFNIQHGVIPVKVVAKNDTFPLFLATKEKGWSAGQKLMEQHPDSVFTVIMSNGVKVKTSKNVYFPDGTDYFMNGKINNIESSFWKKHNYKIK